MGCGRKWAEDHREEWEAERERKEQILKSVPKKVIRKAILLREIHELEEYLRLLNIELSKTKKVKESQLDLLDNIDTGQLKEYLYR